MNANKQPPELLTARDRLRKRKLELHEPDLAEYLESTKDGVSYSVLKKQQDEKESREALRNLEYDEAQHAINPFKSPNALGAQSELRKKYGAAVTEFYKREANERVSLPWLGEPNLTLMGRISKQPQLHELVKRSITTAKEWATESLLESDKKFSESQASRQAALALLGEQSQDTRKAAAQLLGNR